VFDDSFAHANSSSISYKIRLSNVQRNAGIGRDLNRRKLAVFQFDKSWDTDQLYPLMRSVSGAREREFVDGGRPWYWREGFLSLQRSIDLAFIEMYSSIANLSHHRSVQLRRFPYPAFVDDPFIAAFQRQFPVLLLVALTASVLQMTRTVVHEKETHMTVRLWYFQDTLVSNLSLNDN
jgi:ATP-binding cassette subfamily A (ABC1) protein 3